MYADKQFPSPKTVYAQNEFQRIHDRLVAALLKANGNDQRVALALQDSKAEWDRTHSPVESALARQ